MHPITIKGDIEFVAPRDAVISITGPVRQPTKTYEAASGRKIVISGVVLAQFLTAYLKITRRYQT
jgi:hypothetical protein